MLDPVLPHNRAEYDRLGAQKRRVFWKALLGFPVFSLVLIALLRMGVPDFGLAYLTAAYLACVFVMFGIVEVKRVVIFRRDLIERRPHR